MGDLTPISESLKKKIEMLTKAQAGKVVVENQQMASGFVQLPRFVLNSKDISSNAKLCYAQLLSYAWKDESCFPGINDIMEQLGLSKPTVIKGLKELEDNGLIIIKKWGQGLNNTYLLIDRL